MSSKYSHGCWCFPSQFEKLWNKRSKTSVIYSISLKLELIEDTGEEMQAFCNLSSWICWNIYNIPFPHFHLNIFMSENSKCLISALSEQSFSFFFFKFSVFKDLNATKWPFLSKNWSQWNRKTQLINKNDKKTPTKQNPTPDFKNVLKMFHFRLLWTYFPFSTFWFNSWTEKSFVPTSLVQTV